MTYLAHLGLEIVIEKEDWCGDPKFEMLAVLKDSNNKYYYTYTAGCSCCKDEPFECIETVEDLTLLDNEESLKEFKEITESCYTFNEVYGQVVDLLSS